MSVGVISNVKHTVIPEAFALLVFACLIFAVIYYSQFHEAVNIRCSKKFVQIRLSSFWFSPFLSTANH